MDDTSPIRRNRSRTVIDLNTQVDADPVKTISLLTPTPDKPPRPRTMVDAIAQRFEGRRRTSAGLVSRPTSAPATERPVTPIAENANPPTAGQAVEALSTIEKTSKPTTGRAFRKRDSARKRETRRRRRCERALKAQSQRDSLWRKLVHHTVRPLKGKRRYTYELSELIARVGTAPSAAGARSPLASIIGHVTSFVFWLLKDNDERNRHN